MRQITVSVDEDLVDLIDEVADSVGRSRSNLVHLVLQKWAADQDE